MRAGLAFTRILRRLGAPGVVGVGVFVACGALYFTGYRPLHARVDAARGAVEELAASRARGSAPAPEAGLEAFYRHFATGVSTEAWLARIFALARDQRLELLQGTYRYSLPEGERLARYEITLPVAGDYAQIRGFVAAVLNSVPVASLDRISFARKRASDSQVEATVRLTLFLEPRPAEGRP